jgi:hypothetical protein
MKSKFTESEFEEAALGWFSGLWDELPVGA